MVLGVIVDLGYCFVLRVFAFSSSVLRVRRICELFYNCEPGFIQSGYINATNSTCHANRKLARGIIVVMAYA